ncbi:MAG: hypothetical protein KatS3mg057_3175 [Herpetosiphonaceae bacterium]|nr:MAG: hypothetical protein KatS3mg057_3175 [Herpetosiphonaceae bacterium]
MQRPGYASLAAERPINCQALLVVLPGLLIPAQDIGEHPQVVEGLGHALPEAKFLEQRQACLNGLFCLGVVLQREDLQGAATGRGWFGGRPG